MLLLLLDCLKLTSSLAEADGPAQAAAGAFVMKLQAHFCASCTYTGTCAAVHAHAKAGEWLQGGTGLKREADAPFSPGEMRPRFLSAREK